LNINEHDLLCPFGVNFKWQRSDSANQCESSEPKRHPDYGSANHPTASSSRFDSWMIMAVATINSSEIFREPKRSGTCEAELNLLAKLLGDNQ
jgi:hypothetical protein